MAKRGGRSRKKRSAARGAGSRLTAQAIVRAASGKALRGAEPITTRTLEAHAPSREDAAMAQAAFRDAGFEVSELGGISVTITGSKKRFEELFGIELDVDEQGAVTLAGEKAASGGLELPLDHLPQELRRLLEAVAFEAPADLHDDDASALF